MLAEAHDMEVSSLKESEQRLSEQLESEKARIQGLARV